MNHLVEMIGISKSFDGIAALHGVDFRVGENEIVGLLGDNGAGKSTLIKILSGLHRPDSGEIRIKGHPVDLRTHSVRQARTLGIETVFQERSLAEKQPLWRNVFAGRHLANRWGFIRVGRERRATEMILRQLLGLTGIGAHPDSPVKVLSGGERQGLAIGRAMYFGADIVILDEPTTALALNEAEKVLDFIRSIKANGRSAIYISHTLPHVYSVADRFVFLERGRIAAEARRDETTLEGLSETLMAISGRPGRTNGCAR